MNKKIFTLTAFLLVFAVLFSGNAYAGTKVSIDNVFVNGQNLAENKNNLIIDSDNLDVFVVLAGINFFGPVNVQAILTDLNTGNTIANSASTFASPGFQTAVDLNLQLIDSLKRQKDFRLVIKVFDIEGNNIEQKSFNIKFTGGKKGKGILDVSIDRVRVNNKIVAESTANFIEESNSFDVLVELTALEDLEDARVEAILKDLRSGFVVADATYNFDLPDSANFLAFLNLKLLDKLKQSDSFELTIKVVDAEGNSIQKTYGLRMRDDNIVSGGALDISIDRVRVNNKIVVASKTTFIDETDDFNVLVDFTALENLENAHLEAILKDLRSGFVVADATYNFNLSEGSSTSSLLTLNLLNDLKKSNSFELTVRIVDAEGDSIQKTFGLGMKDDNTINIMSGTSQELDISIDSVEVEDEVVVEDESNFIVIKENKKELDLSVKLTALEDIEKARIDAILTFENGDVVADTTATFDIKDSESIVKELEIPLIGKFEQNNFGLRLRIIDAEGNLEEKFYGLKISKQKFPFVISSISLSPESNVEAGKNLVATLNFKNSGVMPLEGINARVSIPELGISSTKFVDQIKTSGKLSEIREDFILKILDNVQTGTYTLKSEIYSQFGDDKEVKEIPVFVLGKNEQSKQVVNDKLVINIPVLKQDIYNDGSEVIYPITLTNQGPDANTYILLLDDANWANLRLSESNTFVIKPKESRTINIYASSKGNAKGEQIFLAAIKSDDKILSQIQLKGNVIPVKGLLAAELKDILEIMLICLVVFLIAMGFFFGIKSFVEENGSKSKELPDSEIETYY